MTDNPLVYVQNIIKGLRQEFVDEFQDNFDTQLFYAVVSPDDENQRKVWVTGSIIAEPRIRTFDHNHREFSAILIVIHVPKAINSGYQVLDTMDRKILNKIRLEGRLMMTPRMTDLVGPARTLERERVVFIR